MTLSDGMRLGSMALPPVHGPFFRYDAEGRICGACAMGAAMYAAGITGVVADPDMFAVFPLLVQSVTVPEGAPSTERVLNTIIWLFEYRGWSRERIADWVETIEQAQQTPAVEPVAVHAE